MLGSSSPNWLNVVALTSSTLVSIGIILGVVWRWLKRRSDAVVDERLRDLGLLPDEEKHKP